MDQLQPNKFKVFNASCLSIYGLSLILVSPFILDVSGFYKDAPEDHYPRISGVFMHIVQGFLALVNLSLLYGNNNNRIRLNCKLLFKTKLILLFLALLTATYFGQLMTLYNRIDHINYPK